VLSGPGLYNIYPFLRGTGRGEEPGWLARGLAGPDPAAAIARAALDGRSVPCDRALKVMATGGVFIGGGTTPKIID
jgi:glucokinase